MSITVERDTRVWWVTLDRPHKLNALNEQIRADLEAVIAELARTPEVSVAVIRGAGRAFSAGADLGEWSGKRADTWAVRRHTSGSWQRTLDALEALPQATVASLHGHCIGGAALLATSCDLRVADESLTVKIPELAVGIPLTWAGIPRLAREVGLPLARDLVMTGRALNAHEALACGFVQRLCPEGDLGQLTSRVVGELLAMPPGPLALTKALTSALGRERTLVAGWADADMLSWSMREAESRSAAASYRDATAPGRAPDTTVLGDTSQ